jgi:hypothetical protein
MQPFGRRPRGVGPNEQQLHPTARVALTTEEASGNDPRIVEDDQVA